MSRTIKHIAATIIVAALLIPAVAQAADMTPKRRVVVLLAPYLTWTDISASMPAARALASRALLMNMNVRAGGVMGASTPDRGALVLSAGAPVNFADGALPGYSASETVGTAAVRDLYRQYFGVTPGSAEVLYLGQPKQLLANADPNLVSVIGALGSAAHSLGVRTVAIGNGDLGIDADTGRSSRPAAEAAADASGTVDLGDVSAAMLRADPAAPFGTRADASAILAQYSRAMADPSTGLVFVDPGDLSRANAIVSVVTSGAASTMRAQALATTDEILAGLVAGAGPDDAILVISQAVVSVPDMPAGYGPAIVHEGVGENGAVGASASTHRDGIVTAMDVSATIVELLGGTAPDSMVGSRVTAGVGSYGATVEERIAFLDRLDTTSVAVESERLSVVNTFIILAVIVLLGAALVLYRGDDGLPAWLPVVARVALLVPIALLLGAAAQGALWRWPATGNQVVLALLATTALGLALALVPWRGRPATFPLIVLCGLTTLTLLVDQWMGAPLSLTGLFSYSALLGARYYGMGNEMAGLLFGSALIAYALVLDAWPKAKWAGIARTWGWPLMGLVVLATGTAPTLGANVGLAAWMTAGLLVGWLMLNGKKVLTWRNLAIVVVLIILVVVALSAADLLGGSGSETHLGRALSGARTGGIGTLWTIVARKAETNMRVLGRTNWTWMLVAVLVLLGYSRWRPRGEFAAMLKRFPAVSVAIAAALFAGVVGYFTEDSGIIIPALMFIPVGVTALYLMLLPNVPSKGDVA